MRKITVVVCAVLCFGLAGIDVASAQDEKEDPPCSDAEYSQFDFWVGEWRVTDPNGEFQGTNRIEKILDGCALQENWTGAQGTRGHSYNAFAKRRGIWHQTWVDSNGTVLLLDGGFQEGKMVLTGQTPSRDGKGIVLHEISWEEMADGRVRQIWRISRDDGSTWIDAFIGLYTREK